MDPGTGMLIAGLVSAAAGAFTGGEGKKALLSIKNKKAASMIS